MFLNTAHLLPTWTWLKLCVYNFVFADMQKLRTVIKPKLRPRSAPKTRVVNPAPQMMDTIIIKPQSKVKTTNNKINNYN